MAYLNLGKLSLPDLEELLRQKKDRLLINPASMPASSGPYDIPSIPVSSRAAEELTPEQIEAIQSKKGERAGNVLQTLGALAALFNPLAGGLMMREGRRREGLTRGSKIAMVEQAEEAEKLRKEREAENQRIAIARQHALVAEGGLEEAQKAGEFERGPKFGLERDKYGLEKSLGYGGMDIQRKKYNLDEILGMRGLEQGERDLALKERMAQAGVTAEERNAQLAERNASLDERKVEYERQYQKGMLDYHNKMLKQQADQFQKEALQEAARAKMSGMTVPVKDIKSWNDAIRDQVKLKADTATERDLLGNVGKIPSLITQSWWADAADELGAPPQMSKSASRARKLKEFVDPSRATGKPYQEAKSLIAKKLAAKTVTPSEYNMMVEYLDFLYAKRVGMIDEQPENGEKKPGGGLLDFGKKLLPW